MSSASEILGLCKGSKYNSPWEFPNCPECNRHICVDRYGGVEADFICYMCSERFDLPPKDELREELR